MKYTIRLAIDSETDPPGVEIVNDRGQLLMEIFEEPTLAEEGRQPPWEPPDWRPGPMAKWILKLLNESEGEPKWP